MQEGEGNCRPLLSGAKPAWCMLGTGRDGHGEQQEGGGGGGDEEEEGQMEAGAGHSFAQQIRELRSRNCEVKLDGGNGTRRTGLLCPSRMTVRAEERPDGSLGRVRLEYTVTHWNHPVGVLNAMNASVWWSCQYIFCFSSAALLSSVLTRGKTSGPTPGPSVAGAASARWSDEQENPGEGEPCPRFLPVLVRVLLFLLLLDLPVCAAPRGRSLPRRGH